MIRPKILALISVALVVIVAVVGYRLFSMQENGGERAATTVSDQSPKVVGDSGALPDADQPARTPQPVSSSSVRRVPTPAAIVERSGTFADAIREAKVLYGDGDPRVSNMMNMANVICENELDPLRALDPKHPDPSRSWAIVRLATLCEDYRTEASTAPPIKSADKSLAETLKRSGPEAAKKEALDVIAEAEDFPSLFTAGTVLLETGGLPLDTILGSERQNYGNSDLLRAWGVAIQVAECRRGGGCGPNSLPTATICAAAGCKQGISYEQALRQELSSSQYQAAMALAGWIQSRRASAR